MAQSVECLLPLVDTQTKVQAPDFDLTQRENQLQIPTLSGQSFRKCPEAAAAITGADCFLSVITLMPFQ